MIKRKYYGFPILIRVDSMIQVVLEKPNCIGLWKGLREDFFQLGYYILGDSAYLLNNSYYHLMTQPVPKHRKMT